MRLKMTKREDLGPVPGKNEKKEYVAVLKEAQEVENDFGGSTGVVARDDLTLPKRCEGFHLKGRAND